MAAQRVKTAPVPVPAKAATRDARRACGGRPSPRALLLGRQAHAITARLVVTLEQQKARCASVLEQVVERAIAVERLVESGLAALERLLDHRSPDLVVLAALGDQRLDGFHHLVDRILAALVVSLNVILARRGGARARLG